MPRHMQDSIAVREFLTRRAAVRPLGKHRWELEDFRAVDRVVRKLRRRQAREARDLAAMLLT